MPLNLLNPEDTDKCTLTTYTDKCTLTTCNTKPFWAHNLNKSGWMAHLKQWWVREVSSE